MPTWHRCPVCGNPFPLGMWDAPRECCSPGCEDLLVEPVRDKDVGAGDWGMADPTRYPVHVPGRVLFELLREG